MANCLTNHSKQLNKSPYEWTCDEVVKWIKTTHFAPKRKKFKRANIDGSKLFALDRVSLQNDVKIFDAKTRSEILLSIGKLKKQWRELHKKKTQKWFIQHSHAPKSKKKNMNDDIPNNRIYIKIRRNKAPFNDIPNYCIQHVLDFYEFATAESALHLASLIAVDMDLIDCLMDNALQTVFIFILRHNIQHQKGKYIYLMSKHVKQWSVQNVFAYFSRINHCKYHSFGQQLERKQINGLKLIKYSRKSLRNDFINYTDSLFRKHIYDEIQTLSATDNNVCTPLLPKSAKTDCNYRQSDIEKQDIRRQKVKKLGPREIGKNSHYKQITYSLTENDLMPSFLNERICISAQYNNFRKRKELNPILPNQTVQQIGNNKHYKQISYSLTESELTGTFLHERIHHLSKNNKFQQRKQKNLLSLKQSVSSISGNGHFEGISYEMRESEMLGTFLKERIHPSSKDNRFKQRKLLNPISPNQTMQQIGDNKHYQQISYQLRKSELMGSFLSDRYHPISKDVNFQKRKQINPIIPNETVSQIGIAHNFEAPDWKLQDLVNDDIFLSEEQYYKGRAAQNRNGNSDVLVSKLGPTAIGRNEHYAAISYDLCREWTDDPFPEKEWYQSSKINDDGLSWLLNNLPSHKLRIMDKVALPTGAQTKIVWLRKLRDIVVDEMRECSKKNGNVAYSASLKKQLNGLNKQLLELQAKR